jgi:hypothetical protein
VPPIEVAILRRSRFVLQFVSVSVISSTTVDVGNILSVLLFVCSSVRQERAVFVLSVTALVQQSGFRDAVEYSGSVISEVGRRVGLVPSQLRFMIPKPAPFLGPQPVADGHECDLYLPSSASTATNPVTLKLEAVRTV